MNNKWLLMWVLPFYGVAADCLIRLKLQYTMRSLLNTQEIECKTPSMPQFDFYSWTLLILIIWKIWIQLTVPQLSNCSHTYYFQSYILLLFRAAYFRSSLWKENSTKISFLDKIIYHFPFFPFFSPFGMWYVSPKQHQMTCIQ